MVLTRRKFCQIFAAASTTAICRSGHGLASSTEEHLTALSLKDVSGMIAAGQVTPTQLTAACLQRIRVYNPKLEAFITVLADQALTQAKVLDHEQQAGRLRSPLHGIPIAVKDNMDTAGTRTTAGSAVLDDHVPTQNAEVVERLIAAGAVVMGKTNMSEFAFGVSYYGSVRNPWALDRDTGGSSSGSAAAVASDLCYGALGTDTGCSVRMPAAWCGVLGFKPTYGLVPLRGIVPDVPSYAHCGPLARSSEDIALLLTQLAGYDRLDITSVNHPREDYFAAMRRPVGGFRIGVARVPFFDHLDPEIADATEQAIEVIAKLTRGTRDVVLPSTKDQNLDTNAEMFVYHQELFKHYSDQYMLAATPAERRSRTIYAPAPIWTTCAESSTMLSPTSTWSSFPPCAISRERSMKATNLPRACSRITQRATCSVTAPRTMLHLMPMAFRPLPFLADSRTRACP
jgi:aspartyl-tRNA(Asn)/glutamyl-tRNA(Gln) amidotransferase subunit A